MKTKLFRLFAVMAIAITILSACHPDEPISPIIPPVMAGIVIKPATAISFTAATLNAKVVPHEDGTKVWFTYGAEGLATTVTDTLDVTYSGQDSVDVYLTVTGLQAGTAYVYTAGAKNRAGVSPITSASRFTTYKELVKPGVVVKPVTNVTLTSAKLNAKVKPNEDGTKVWFTYGLKNATATITDTLTVTYSGLDSIDVSLSISGLQVGGEYSFTVGAKNVAGITVTEVAKFATYAVTDYDGNMYHAIKIGDQTWLQENFKGTHFANGDPIPNVTDGTTWAALTTPAYCWYNNDAEIGKVYGGLYNWYVASDSRGLISGWHMPTGMEWSHLGELVDPVPNCSACSQGGPETGIKLMEVGFTHWLYSAMVATNKSGFTALPNGGMGELTRNSGIAEFHELGKSANWWSSDAFGSGAVIAEINANNCEFAYSKIMKFQLGTGIRLMKN